MFESARLKLTAWYLLIIMVISIIFSFAFYDSATREIRRLIKQEQSRPEYQGGILQTPDGDVIFAPAPPRLNIEALEGVQHRLQLTLVFINLGIFGLAGAAAYFLAGRTLTPIRVMVEEQNRFITDASHELRTPLTALRSEIEVYLRGKKHSSRDTTELAQSNLEEVIHLQALADNLLELAHYDTTTQKQLFVPLSIEKIIADACKKVEPLAKAKHIALKNTTSPAKVQGNAQSLGELFVILLDNAIKYSPEASMITLSTKSSGHSLKVMVQDEGIGIDKEDLPHIFERFYRVDKSRTKTDVPGYGLGLSIAKKIAESHKGTLSVASTLGTGTTFTVTLPYLHTKE